MKSPHASAFEPGLGIPKSWPQAGSRLLPREPYPAATPLPPSADEPVQVIDQDLWRRGLQCPAGTRALVLLVYMDPASLRQSGQRFVADVLQANGLATLAVTLHPTREQESGVVRPGLVAAKHRLRALFSWLTRQSAVSGLPIALLGFDDAVRACIAAAARYRLAALRTLVLFEGQPYQATQLMARLSQPTLLVIGSCDERTLAKHRAALRQMSAPSRLELLPMRTRPTPAAGVHQALARTALGWLSQTLWPQSSHSGTSGLAVDAIRGSRGADDSANGIDS